MSDNTLGVIDVQVAESLMRHVDAADALEAGILTPMAGTRSIRLFGIEEAERFLVLHDGRTVAKGGAWATVNYVEPAQLAAWIGEVLGDRPLADALNEIAATRRPYGFLVGEMKSVIAARIEQAKLAVGTQAVPVS